MVFEFHEMPREKYAHSIATADPSSWHQLGDHLRQTAEKARSFAESWGAGEWGYLAGLWHDLGKCADDWQDFLLRSGMEGANEDPDGLENPFRRRRGPDHSSAGAIHAQRRFATISLPLQFAIAGHHAGLADRGDLKSRLEGRQSRYDGALRNADPKILEAGDTLSLPAFVTDSRFDEEGRRRLETFTRMIFSVLVDADFLDTERFFASAQMLGPNPMEERAAWPRLEAYLPVLEEYLAALERNAPETTVNAYRRNVRQWCEDKASGPRRAYTLTVPTGGGKTLSSLLFALRHASEHGLRRVVIALPFISILDQTAAVFREIFEPGLGPHVLVEHHSAIEPVRDTTVNRLASENWDAPLIVTTQVQLFESLFSRRYSQCRKLHNLADSVLILDEVQTLPASLLSPIIDVLRELQTHYGTSLLLTTATQPSLHSRALGPWRFEGFDPRPVEVVPELQIEQLFAAFRRVARSLAGDERPCQLGRPGGHLESPSPSSCYRASQTGRRGPVDGAAQAGGRGHSPPVWPDVPCPPQTGLVRDPNSADRGSRMSGGLDPSSRSWCRRRLPGRVQGHGRSGGAGAIRRTLQPRRPSADGAFRGLPSSDGAPEHPALAPRLGADDAE
ncbi:MAG: CRISPR-associated endonuclease Cas3'' [Acidobacteria bacterium]|nr:MAG: CRISPR-associated endonuclease Cas3'' [Acidobacteriota bacterium]